MLRSLFSGVAGLTSHQTKLDVIGNNIANVNTYGFKSSRVTFSDVYYQTTKSATGASATQGGINSSQIGYGSSVASIDKMMSQSAFASTSSSLDISISGEGFIQVQDKSGNKFFTRAGMLNVDSEGNLVDTSGYFVLGTYNGDTNKDIAGMSTTAGNSKLSINVPDVYVAKTAALTVAATTTPAVSGATVTAGFLNGNQRQNINITFTSTGTTTAVTSYDPEANPNTMTINISPKDKANLNTVTELQDKINQAIVNELGKDPATALLTDDNFSGGNVSITLDTSAAVGAAGATAAGTLTPDENKAVQKQAVNDILAGTTAINMTSAAEKQSFSDLSSFYISGDGTLVGVHAALGMLYFGRIDLATFNNPQGLNEKGNSYFEESAASGSPQFCVPGFDGAGAVVSGSLEMSNVNLATEFSDLITTQRGYQANARIITTSDSILEELVNLKR